MNYIVGGGFFGHFSILPVILAWETFGQNNGAKTIEATQTVLEQTESLCKEWAA
jgi:hypothetical protein